MSIDSRDRSLCDAEWLTSSLWESLVAVVDLVVSSPRCWSRKPRAHSRDLDLQGLVGIALPLSDPSCIDHRHLSRDL